jgi:hypothetical protein
MTLKDSFLRLFTWWNGANLNTLFYTSRQTRQPTGGDYEAWSPGP